VNARTDSGETVLHYAAFPKNAWFATALLKAGADLRAKNQEGRMPRDLAAEGGHSAIAKLLESAHQ